MRVIKLVDKNQINQRIDNLADELGQTGGMVYKRRVGEIYHHPDLIRDKLLCALLTQLPQKTH